MPDEAASTTTSYPLRPGIDQLEASQIVQLWQAGMGRKDLIPLYVGEGDLPTPGFICDAAERSLRAGETFYSAKRGIPELREALARYEERTFGVTMDPARITVTSSGMAAILMVLQATLSPGDNLVVVTPCWPNIFMATRVVGAETRQVEIDPLAEGGFRLDLDKLFNACDERTRAIFLVSPANPTGWIAAPDEQAAILDFCRRRGIWLIADEVYHRFVYDPSLSRGPGAPLAAPSLLALAQPEDPVFVVNSFSKTWAMTGWRMGWLTHPPSLGPLFDNLIEFNTSGGQAFIQRAGIAALEEGEPFVVDYIDRCRRAGDLVFQRLSALPRVRIARPRGSFYSFFGLDGMDDSFGFAKALLTETGVGLAPGSAFGAGGEGYLRLCFATSAARLSEALDRIEPKLA